MKTLLASAIATGLCEFDQPLDVMMVELEPAVLREVGMDDPEAIAPQVGDFDPVTLQLSMAAEGFNEGGTLYRETMHRALAAQLTKPLAVVHSEAAAIPQGVQAFLEGYVGDATLQMLEDVTQFDFYDNPEDVTRAADTVAEHFRASGAS